LAVISWDEEMKEALNAICVTITTIGAHLHWSSNGPDVNPMDQVTGTVSISGSGVVLSPILIHRENGGRLIMIVWLTMRLIVSWPFQQMTG
jgi:hypothetical protein